MTNQAEPPGCLNGQTAQNIALSDHFRNCAGWGIQVPTLYHCEPAWKWNRTEPLDDFDLWTVLAGKGEMEMEGTRSPLEAGSWFLLQPGDRPRARHDPAHPLVVFACHFQPGKTGREAREVLTGRYPEPPHREAERAAQVYHEGATGRALATAILSQMVLQAFHSLARPADPGQRHRLDILAREIRSSPGSDWTAEGLARRAGLSTPHFNRLWRSAWGVAPRQFIIRERVARAVLLLRESDLTIQQIAESLGYNDIFYFHRQFRQVAGATPRAARLGAGTRLDPP